MKGQTRREKKLRTLLHHGQIHEITCNHVLCYIITHEVLLLATGPGAAGHKNGHLGASTSRRLSLSGLAGSLDAYPGEAGFLQPLCHLLPFEPQPDVRHLLAHPFVVVPLHIGDH